MTTVPQTLVAETTTTTTTQRPADDPTDAAPLIRMCFHCKCKQEIVDVHIGTTEFYSTRKGVKMNRLTYYGKCKKCGCTVQSFKKSDKPAVTEPEPEEEEEKQIENK